jgi:hypothetical protein
VDERVSIADLVGPNPIVHGREFIRCVIHGNGQIKLHSKTTVLFCSTIERNIVVVPMGSNITGAVIISECTFVECYFDVAIVGTTQDAQIFRGAVEIESCAEWRQKYAVKSA